MIKGKSVEEIRKVCVALLLSFRQKKKLMLIVRLQTFNIVNDFTPEEEEQIRKVFPIYLCFLQHLNLIQLCDTGKRVV